MDWRLTKKGICVVVYIVNIVGGVVSLLVEGHVEDAIALDVAAGLPSERVVQRHGLASLRALKRILERPRVGRLVVAYRQQVIDGAAITHAKKVMRVDEVLDGLFEIATNPEHPRQAQVGMWIVDGVSPPTAKVEGQVDHLHQHVIGGEVVEKFANTVDKFAQLVTNRSPVFELEAGDQHLHDGQQFMRDREEEIASLGVTRQEGELG